ncbi:MAG: hypothetical protein ACFUZC_12115 [Chthoniobacteraceae bacterium]
MQKFWLRQGGLIAAQVNSACWLEFAVPAVAVWCFVAGCLLLVARHEGWNSYGLLPLSGAVFLIIAAQAFWRTAHRWFTREDGLARLDSVLGLHNRLSSAAAGVGPWPSPMRNIRSGFRWRWLRLVAPAALGGLFLIAAAKIPISRASNPVSAKIEPPLAWSQVETALEELKRAQVPDQDALAAMDQKLDALRRQSPESWYSQSSLEAGAALAEETAHAVSSLEHHLNAAAQALTPGLQYGNGASIPQDKEALWNEAIKGLQMGALPLNKTDCAALTQCGSGKCSLSREQIAALQKKVRQQAGVCTLALASLGDALSNANYNGKLDSPQDQPGQPGGGGGTAPLGIRPTPTSLEPGQQTALQGGNREDAALGDVVGVTAGEHKVDQDAVHGSAFGGNVSSEGNGGEAVWSITPSPKEGEVLKAYFK